MKSCPKRDQKTIFLFVLEELIPKTLEVWGKKVTMPKIDLKDRLGMKWLQYWTYSEHTLNIPWTYPKHTLNILWTYPEYTLNIPWSPPSTPSRLSPLGPREHLQVGLQNVNSESYWVSGKGVGGDHLEVELDFKHRKDVASQRGLLWEESDEAPQPWPRLHLPWLQQLASAPSCHLPRLPGRRQFILACWRSYIVQEMEAEMLC